MSGCALGSEVLSGMNEDFEDSEGCEASDDAETVDSVKAQMPLQFFSGSRGVGRGGWVGYGGLVGVWYGLVESGRVLVGLAVGSGGV